MSVEALESTVSRSMAAAVAAGVAYKSWAHHSRNARIARIPEGGMEQSLLPFYQVLPQIVADCDIETYVSSGGLAKQALLDPDTEFDPSARQYAVTNPHSSTLKKATLYRPGEGTLRDFDLRVFSLWLNGELVSADAELDEQNGIKEQRKARMQSLLNDKANELGFPFGPEVSLFFYEKPFKSFRPWHYATRTIYDADQNTETIFATTGHFIQQERDDLWECLVDLPGKEPIVIPVNSPATHLGRTMVRPLIERQRDKKDIENAVLNIRVKGLDDELLGPRWEGYVSYRRWLDSALNSNQIRKRFEHEDIAVGLNMLLARYIGVPLAPKIESSEIGAVIRDPEHIIGKLAARSMGA